MTEPVTISLNFEQQSVFFVPGKLHLSYEEPGPIQIDPTVLTEEEKGWINQAAQAGVLTVKNPNKVPVPKSKSEAKRIKVQQEASNQEELPKGRQDQVAVVKKFLSGKVAGVRAAVENSNDILFLRLVREIEQDNKKRKTILSLVSDKIAAIQSSVQEELGMSPDEELGQHYTDHSLRNLPEVEETAERTIIVKPLSEDDA